MIQRSFGLYVACALHRPDFASTHGSSTLRAATTWLASTTATPASVAISMDLLGR